MLSYFEWIQNMVVPFTSVRIMLCIIFTLFDFFFVCICKMIYLCVYYLFKLDKSILFTHWNPDIAVDQKIPMPVRVPWAHVIINLRDKNSFTSKVLSLDMLCFHINITIIIIIIHFVQFKKPNAYAISMILNNIYLKEFTGPLTNDKNVRSKCMHFFMSVNWNKINWHEMHPIRINLTKISDYIWWF